jgi:two-component system, cell cycle sensor histidine kinase and response regulator CckA
MTKNLKNTIHVVRERLPPSIQLVLNEEEDLRISWVLDDVFEKILLQFIWNSRMAISDRGTIWIDLFSREEDICLAIEDDGSGSHPSMEYQKWRPFSRAGNKKSNVGLGVSVMMNGIQIRGGSLSLQHPRYCPGRRFEFRFPKHGTEGDSGDVGPLQSLRVLVVEDDLDLQGMLTDILGSHGCRVSGFSDAEAAQRAFALGAFDLILSDVSLPKMDGIGLAQSCVAMDPNLQVVLISGCRPSALSVQGHGWTFLLKPFTPEALVNTILQAL